MPKESFAERVQRWERMDAGLTERADELAFLAADHATLQTLVGAAKGKDARQEALKAELQQETQGLNQTVKEILALEKRLRSSLKGKYGASNEVLESFGIRPRKRR